MDIAHSFFHWNYWIYNRCNLNC